MMATFRFYCSIVVTIQMLLIGELSVYVYDFNVNQLAT